MSAATIAFIGFGLFIIHEFEEIVRVAPWVRARSGDPRFRNEIFISGGAESYPSTETIALMILEEAILSLIILGAAIVFNFSPLACALIMVSMLHLLAHVADAVGHRFWTPGSVTAAITLVLNGACVGFAFVSAPSIIVGSIVLMPVVGAVMMLNLRLLHRRAQSVESWRKRHE